MTERVEALRRELRRLDEMETDLGQRLNQGQARERQLNERRVWLSEERERTDLAAHDVAAERDRAEAEARRASERHEGLVTAARAAEHELRSGEAELRRLVESMHEIELAATERRVRREELGQEAQRAYGVDEGALIERHDPDRDSFRRCGARELTDKLGSSNRHLVADEKPRAGAVTSSDPHDDREALIKDWRRPSAGGRTGGRSSRHSRRQPPVRRDFERLSKAGGGAAIVRRKGGDPLDTGVEIMAKPRGKSLQAARSCRGERATRSRVLFAIFYFGGPSVWRRGRRAARRRQTSPVPRVLRELRDRRVGNSTKNGATMEAAESVRPGHGGARPFESWCRELGSEGASPPSGSGGLRHPRASQ